MPNTAKDWRLYVPTGTGAFDCPLPVRCGDILDVVDNTIGIQQTSFQLDVRNGKYFSTYRHRTPQLSEMTVQVTEAGADAIDRLRDPSCMSYIQRRKYCAGSKGIVDWDIVEHYSRVNYGERGLTSPTAQGIDVRDDIPTVQVQAFFENRTLLDKTPPYRRIIDGVEYPLQPIDTVYCDDPTCGYIGRTDIRGDEEFPRNNPPGDGCDTLFSLYAALPPAPDTFYLERSDDGGQTWTQITTDITTSFSPNMIHCYYGRLFIGFGEEVYFSDDAVFGTTSTWTRITAFNEPRSIGPIIDVTMIPLGSGGKVIAMAHSRWGLFALYDDGENANGITRCWEDRGDDLWEPVLPASADRGTYFDIDVAGYGTVIAASGHGDDGFGNQVGEITFNYVFGSFTYITTAEQLNTWYTQQYSGAEFGDDPSFIAISLASYNPNYNRSVFAYIWNSSTDPETFITTNRIMKSKDLEGFVTVFEHVENYTNTKPAKLRNALDGVVVWGHRHSFSARDTVTVKSIDGGCTWIRFEDDKFNYGEVLACYNGGFPDRVFAVVLGIQETCDLQVGDLVCVTFADETVKVAEILLITDGIGFELEFLVPTACADNGGIVAVTCHPDNNILTPCPSTSIILDSTFALCEHDPNVAFINGIGVSTMPPSIGPNPVDDGTLSLPPGY